MAIDSFEQDWPMRDRVPNRHSYLAADLSGKYRIAWKVRLSSTLVSQPIVFGTRVIVNTMTRLHALDIEDGDQEWEFLPIQSRLSEEHSANKGTPAILGGGVLLADLQGHLYSIDRDSGTENWHTHEYRSRDESPCVVNDIAFVRFRGAPEIEERDYGYACLNNEGEEIWSFNSRAEVISSQPAAWDGKVYFTDKAGYIYALDVKSGALAWEQDLRTLVSKPQGTPRRLEYGYGPLRVINGLVVMHYAVGNHLIAIDATDGSLSWVHQSEFPIYAQASDSALLLYAWAALSGSVSAISLSTGQLVWRQDTDSALGDVRVRSGLAIGSHFLVPYSGAKLIASYSTNSGKEIWKFKGEGGFSGEPVFAQGRLLIGDDRGTLYCFEPEEL